LKERGGRENKRTKSGKRQRDRHTAGRKMKGKRRALQKRREREWKKARRGYKQPARGGRGKGEERKCGQEGNKSAGRGLKRGKGDAMKTQALHRAGG